MLPMALDDRNELKYGKFSHRKKFSCNVNNVFLHDKGSMKKEYNNYGSHVKEEIHRV